MKEIYLITGRIEDDDSIYDWTIGFVETEDKAKITCEDLNNQKDIDFKEATQWYEMISECDSCNSIPGCNKDYRNCRYWGCIDNIMSKPQYLNYYYDDLEHISFSYKKINKYK